MGGSGGCGAAWERSVDIGFMEMGTRTRLISGESSKELAGESEGGKRHFLCVWATRNWGEWLLLLALCQRQDCKPLEFTFVLYSTQTIIREMREHLATPLSLTTNKWISMEAAD